MVFQLNDSSCGPSATTGGGFLMGEKWEISLLGKNSEGYRACQDHTVHFSLLRPCLWSPSVASKQSGSKKQKVNSLSSTACSALVPEQKPGILTFGEHVPAATNKKLRSPAPRGREAVTDVPWVTLALHTPATGQGLAGARFSTASL